MNQIIDMNYFAMPGHAQADKGVIHNGCTVAKPLPDEVRVRELLVNNIFRMNRIRYKVMQITDRRIYYSPFVYYKSRKKSFLAKTVKEHFGRNCKMRVRLIA